MIMAYLSNSSIAELGNLAQVKNILSSNGWSTLTAVNVMLFSLFHFPCSTTLITIKKETGSMKWTALAFALPTVVGVICCMAVNAVWSLFI